MCKSSLKTEGHHAILSSRGQKIKNITKIEHKRLFLSIFLASFFTAFLAQKLLHAII